LKKKNELFSAKNAFPASYMGKERIIDTTTFISITSNPYLCEYIHSCAWGRAKGCLDTAEYYIREAWYRLSLAPDEKTIDYYCERARKAIRAACKREKNISDKEVKMLKKIIHKGD